MINKKAMDHHQPMAFSCFPQGMGGRFRVPPKSFDVSLIHPVEGRPVSKAKKARESKTVNSGLARHLYPQPFPKK
jgi:hypothetical protein